MGGVISQEGTTTTTCLALAQLRDAIFRAFWDKVSQGPSFSTFPLFQTVDSLKPVSTVKALSSQVT